VQAEQQQPPEDFLELQSILAAISLCHNKPASHCRKPNLYFLSHGFTKSLVTMILVKHSELFRTALYIGYKEVTLHKNGT
jgi:hypothetical protein